MKRRFAINDEGMLVDRDGVVLGRITAITIDVPKKNADAALIAIAEGETSTTAPPPPVGGSDGGEDSAMRVWMHYVEVMGPRRKQLDPDARRIIRNALEVATADECVMAINGCRASAFHMGSNDRGRPYNRLTHILKGKRGGRTTREQIDFFLDVAAKSGVQSDVSSVDPARLAAAKRDVLDAHEFPGDEGAVQRGKASEEWLAQHGWKVIRDVPSGPPTFRRDEA